MCVFTYMHGYMLMYASAIHTYICIIYAYVCECLLYVLK